MTGFRIAALAAGIALTGALAAAESEGADPRLGDKVDRICFGRDINNFKAIEGEDDVVLLERGVNDWYKVELIGACDYSELKWSQAVAIDQRPAGGCLTPGDYLIFTRSAFGEFNFANTRRCAVSAIYKWNEKAAAPEDGADGEPDEN